jgi:glucosamine kinase
VPSRVDGVWLGLDAGASALKWCLSGGGALHQGRQAPLTGLLFNDEDIDSAREVLDRARSDMGSVPIRGVVMGAPGLSTTSGEARSIMRGLLGSVFGTDNVHVLSDSELGYLGNLQPGEGVFVYAGTGSVVIHVTKAGEVLQTGGRGFILGDEGGGFWMGREALRHVAGFMDRGQDPFSDGFAAAVALTCGISDWAGLRSFAYGEHRREIARLTHVIGEWASAGDVTASDIVHRAAVHLADQVRTMQQRAGIGASPVVATGGAFSTHPDMLGWLSKQLQADVRSGLPNAAVAAAQMCQDMYPASVV